VHLPGGMVAGFGTPGIYHQESSHSRLTDTPTNPHDPDGPHQSNQTPGSIWGGTGERPEHRAMAHDISRFSAESLPVDEC
jgi:hypothetical protein